MRVILVDLLLRDAFFATLMNGALLWVCTRILRQKPRWGWMLSAAVLGGIYQFSLGVRWELGSVSGWEWPLFIGVGGFIALISWPTRYLSQALRRIFLFYLLTFLTVGVSMGARSLLELTGAVRISSWQYFIVNLSSLAIVAELGWGMIREAIWTRANLAKILIQLGGQELYVDGLIDTGNVLCDPLTQIPVVILSLPAVRSALPENIIRLIEQLMAGDMPEQAMEEFWRTRVKILPFVSMGNANGLMIGLTIERLEVLVPEKLTVKPAILGFTSQKFSSGDYQAIVPAALFHRGLSLQH